MLHNWFQLAADWPGQQAQCSTEEHSSPEILVKIIAVGMLCNISYNEKISV